MVEIHHLIINITALALILDRMAHWVSVLLIGLTVGIHCINIRHGIGNVILTFLGGNVTGDGQNGFFDIGNIRVQWGTFSTTTGNLDTVTMQYPFGSAPYTLIAMERQAGGWSGVAPMPTVYGTQDHPTDPANKFLVSCVRVLNNAHAEAEGERTKFERANGQWFGIGLKP